MRPDKKARNNHAGLCLAATLHRLDSMLIREFRMAAQLVVTVSF